ncbi:MAG: sugar phosphate isomerase/epimerase [Desulfobacterota bacterium]|nr:sugar phosphate isomerase/epimerase [Thermodesulfobacteriota bacterium]
MHNYMQGVAMIVGGRAHSVHDVEFIAQAGFHIAEISILNAASFASDLDHLKRIHDAYGIMYLAHGPEEGAATDPDLLRRDYLPRIKAMLDGARELAIRLCTIHFWLDRRFIPHKHLPAKLELLREMAGYAAERDIMLCIENLSERFSDFADALALLDTLGMTLDIGHGALMTQCNTALDFTGNCFERIHHVHIHDNRGGNSAADDLHLPLGEGTIDFIPMLGALKQKGFDKTITIEVRPDHLITSSCKLRHMWESL